MPLGRKLETIPGTRLLASSFGLIGKSFTDPDDGRRVWHVVNTLRCVDSHLEYVRLRVIDQKGFVSFINQMDYELLTGAARAGQLCPWTMQEYPEIGDYKEGWLGLHTESEDLEDDLHLRELEIRSQVGWDVVLPSLELTRYVHTDESTDEEMLEMLLWDADPMTGLGPDMRLETISKRWSRVQRERISWE